VCQSGCMYGISWGSLDVILVYAWILRNNMLTKLPSGSPVHPSHTPPPSALHTARPASSVMFVW
jgi:hypothetical protein